MQKFITALSQENWDTIFSNHNINAIFNCFSDIYLKIFQSCFLNKLKRNPINPKPWLTQGIKTSCYNKRKLYHLSKLKRDRNFTLYFNRYSKLLKSIIKVSKRKYYDYIISNSTNKTKSTWDIVRKLTNKRRNNNKITSIKIKDKLINDTGIIANSFNSYFSTVAQTSYKDIPDKNCVWRSLQNLNHNMLEKITPFYFEPTSINEINKIIKSLKTKDSYGYDEISTQILKISAPFISPPLTFICNQILNAGIFPDRMKLSIIKPLLKKGTNNELKNYRPISLLTTFSKVIEKAIYKRLYRYLDKRKLLSNDQFGFRANLSTIHATNALINSILTALDTNKIVGGLFCDIHKAFDCVNHEILLTKLEFCGVTNIPNKLIRSYLESRYQRVKITNIKVNSSWELVKHGIPQGSVLGPLSFLVYINDLALMLRKYGTPVLFADDTSVIISSPNETEFKEMLCQVVKDTVKWCNDNLLTLNTGNTQFMQFFTKQQKIDVQVSISESIIPDTTSIKFLGLLIDNKLRWKAYGNELAKKLNKACYAIRIVKSSVSSKSLTSIYHSYFHSVLRYGILFWGNSLICRDIFRIQKRAIRIITSKGR